MVLGKYYKEKIKKRKGKKKKKKEGYKFDFTVGGFGKPLARDFLYYYLISK
jgi:hypothetical protein